VLHVLKVSGYGELDPEPVGGPARTKGLAHFGWLELMGGCFLEVWTGLVGRGVDRELDKVWTCIASLNLRKKALFSILAAVGELAEAISIDVVYLLADRTSCKLRIGGGGRHAVMGFSSHDG
jgi:hypothetical protein